MWSKLPVALLMAMLMAMALVACGDDDGNERPDSPNKRVKSVKLGEAVVLRNRSGEALRAKVTRVFDPVRDQAFEDARISGRYVGVELRITNYGDIAHRGSPWSGSRLSTTRGGERPTKQLNQGSCLGTVRRTIPPGARVSVCIPFRVNQDAQLLKFRYTPEAGFAPTAGVWDLRR